MSETNRAPLAQIISSVSWSLGVVYPSPFSDLMKFLESFTHVMITKILPLGQSRAAHHFPVAAGFDALSSPVNRLYCWL